MKRYCYFNGKVVALEKLKISPCDLGILRGYSVFDVMRTQNGKPFLISKHWKRFENSARELNLKIPVSFEKYKEIIEKLLKLNNFQQSNIRTLLSGGISSNGFLLEKGRETFYILIEKFNPLPEEIFKEGLRVITLDYGRNIPRAKTTNYITALKNQKIKNRKKALEIIYLNQGKVLEASSSNLFMVKNEAIITPRDNILLGTTRNLTVELAKKNKFKVEEKEIKISKFFQADEIFLTATNKNIVPVIRIDDKKIGNGKVGEITKKMMKIFKEFAERY